MTKLVDESRKIIQDSAHQKTLSPKADRVLNVLDSEINHILSKEKRPGWTPWAIFGGLATIGWLLFEELETGSFMTRNVILLFLVFSLLVDHALMLTKILATPTPDQKTEPRFHFSFGMSEVRTELFCFTVRFIVLIVIGLLFSKSIWEIHVTLLCISYGFYAFLCLAALVFSFFRIPLPVSPSASKLHYSVMWALFAAGLYAMTGYFGAVPFNAVSLSDYRISTLLVAASYLLLILTKGTQDIPLLSSLINIRRDLVFGHVDVDTAIKKADIVLAGIKVADLFQEQVHELPELHEKYNEYFRKVQGKFEYLDSYIESKKTSENGIIPDDETISSVQWSIYTDILEAGAVLKDIKKRHNKFSRRITFIGRASRESVDIIEKIIDKLRSAADESNKRYEEIRSKIASRLPESKLVGQKRNNN